MVGKKCPKCARQFPARVELCDDCQEPLIPDQPEAGGPPAMVLLTTVKDPAEAVILCNVLRSEGIDATTEETDLLDVPMLDTGTEPKGIPVLVNSGDADRALEVLQAHRAGQLSLDEDESPTDQSM